MDVKTFLMMGPPGCGKGTQGRLLAQKLGAELYSTGKRCREFAAGNTYFGRRTKEIIESGDLMPDWFSIYLFEDKLIGLEPDGVIVFEGSGRKLHEAQTYHEVMQWLGRPYTVVFLDVNEAELKIRLAARNTTEGRVDDAEAVIKMRFEMYHKDTLPALDYFRSQGLLVTVDGNHPIEDVHVAVVRALNLA